MKRSLLNTILLYAITAALITGAIKLTTPAPAPKCKVQKAEVMMTEGDSVWTEVMDVCL